MSKTKRAKRTLRKLMLHRKFGEMIQLFIAPIKRVIDYSSIAQQILNVEPLKKDE